VEMRVMQAQCVAVPVVQQALRGCKGQQLTCEPDRKGAPTATKLQRCNTVIRSRQRPHSLSYQLRNVKTKRTC